MSDQNQDLYRDDASVQVYVGMELVGRPEAQALDDLEPGLREGRVLDIGIGVGRTVPVLSERAASYVGIDYSEPRVRKVLAALKAEGVTKIGVTGYCYGARTGFNLAFENEITALAVSHPSLLQVPQDMEVCCCLAHTGKVLTSLRAPDPEGKVERPAAHQQLPRRPAVPDRARREDN